MLHQPRHTEKGAGNVDEQRHATVVERKYIILTIKHTLYTLNIILYTTFYYHTHYYTLHTNIKTNTLHYKLTYKLYT